MNERPSMLEIEERAAEAQSLLEHPLLEEAMEHYTQSCVNQLLTSQLGSNEALAAQAGLQITKHMRDYLKSLVSQYKVAKKYEGKHNG